ncbi:MAG: dicarboxylate/amino acid:cation symporter [Oscillospiraceae bacterium]|nr:dicarboxylate/amino acid:cation symporter [Oscillospiraceae bacterium]
MHKDKKQSRMSKGYIFPVILLCGIALGSIIGWLAPDFGRQLKPLGDIFLNLVFSLVVPVVFFSISSAVASMADMRRLGKILGYMMLVFVVTGIISSVIMIGAVNVIKPAENTDFPIEQATEQQPQPLSQQIVAAVTVDDFTGLLSRRNMLPLIIMSIFFGFVATSFGEKGAKLAKGLSFLSEIFMRMIGCIMYYAPVGLGAYFAYLVADLGPQLLGVYARTMLGLYYPLCVVYFAVGFFLYAYFAAGMDGVRIFFKNALSPAATSLATQSSIATLPVNLEAARKMGVPKDIREIVLPIGATMHMDGSCFAAILKISILYGIFGREFTGFGVWIPAMLIAILSGIVMSGIPGGGLIGEMLIMTLYGFPMEAFPIIATVGFLVDPPATMINATGDSVAAMMVTRLVEGKNWLKKQLDTKGSCDSNQ